MPLTTQTVQLSNKQAFTVNKYGLTSSLDDPNMIVSLSQIDKQKPVADLGAAFGHSTKVLLNNGFKVIANDICGENLVNFALSLPNEQQSRLVLKPGNVLDLDFEPESLSAIIALRWMHFLSGAEVRALFKKYYNWLAPGGRLIISCRTPYSWTFFSKCQQDFTDNVQNNEEWPGEFDTKDVMDPKVLDNFPSKMNLFTTEILIREAMKAKFSILKVNYYDLSPSEREIIPDGPNKDFCSIIAIKP